MIVQHIPVQVERDEQSNCLSKWETDSIWIWFVEGSVKQHYGIASEAVRCKHLKSDNDSVVAEVHVKAIEYAIPSDLCSGLEPDLVAQGVELRNEEAAFYHAFWPDVLAVNLRAPSRFAKDIYIACAVEKRLEDVVQVDIIIPSTVVMLLPTEFRILRKGIGYQTGQIEQKTNDFII